MSLYDFFFPEQAQASHLRSLANSERQRSRRGRSTSSALKKRVEELEGDLGYLALVLGSLMQKIDEKGLIKRDEMRAVMAELDQIDGTTDGKLDINILRGLGR